MKRPVHLMSMFAAMVLAAPAAMAGNDIVKCVDADGHVTLTDQPCGAGAATVRVDQDRNAAPLRPTTQRHVLPAADLRNWRRPDLSRPAALTGDVATLKAAHRTLMLLDARPTDARTTLAGLP